ncbi:1-deoxy-D-xylulose-5-phosphate synthase [Streptomyces sp. MST-110588]|uniref:1-deoxy-D-xylulose-5-phosphate synthase n=1 Tax=Streptomyces sp. MST-110588 TaxID=2833628 RepID=UPI001F5D4875|nr:1-deoxy-D-xylulose-5-phosphate synthase [Streptomyces sp. MST-110588]UNO41960.1 1-deoxy-D-xylulose-5-phosphate synthase [Streptomyces sp. MST-110588]
MAAIRWSPQALRALSPRETVAVAERIRTFLIENVCGTGGHLGPNLGAVELTLALHRVFDSPRDALIFDTGHQAYVHKIITGRAHGFDRLRQRGGLSGYPSRSESVHDWVENSHASTSLAYADGLGKAFAARGEGDRWVVPVIGDGALTGGLAWEALNNLGTAGRRRIAVVLNDNGRSYAPTTGALADHLSALRRPLAQADAPVSAYVDGPPEARNLFTCLGFTYLGPVDGHDLDAVEAALRQAREIGGPVLVHTVTVKGKGYVPAETDDADCLHAVGVVDPATGTARDTAAPTWTDVFAGELAELGAGREDVVAVCAAMLRPTGLGPFADRFPGRVFDVGIAEQQAMCSAAGLSMGGLHPVVALYATFANRAFDQLLMDVALHRLPVTLVLDRAGITGPDGPSHHGMWDHTLLSLVPGLRLAAPRDATTLRTLLGEALADQDGPTALRFPKGAVGADVPAVGRMGQVDLLSAPGRDVLLVGLGAMAAPCLAARERLAARGVEATVAAPRWVLPLPPELVQLAARHTLVVTVEDCARTGGVGSALAQACTDAAVAAPVHSLGLPRTFLTHGSRAELLAATGLDAGGIATAVHLAWNARHRRR